MDVLVVGDANPDLLSPATWCPVRQSEQMVDAALTLGGSGAIVATGLARLEVSVGLAAALGADELGEITAARLEGVDPSALQRTPLPTGLSVHLLRGDDRTSSRAPARSGARRRRRVREDRGGAARAHRLGVPDPGAGRARRRGARGGEGGGRDSLRRHQLRSGRRFSAPEWLLDADALLPNGEEAMRLSRPRLRRYRGARARERGATVAVKLGAEGALVVEGDAVARVPPPARRASWTRSEPATRSTRAGSAPGSTAAPPTARRPLPAPARRSRCARPAPTVRRGSARWRDEPCRAARADPPAPLGGRQRRRRELTTGSQSPPPPCAATSRRSTSSG